MAPKFGSSGLRGLVTELTDELVADYLHAFLSSTGHNTLYLGRDLRPSSPHIAKVILETARASRVDVVDCGALGTPALALASMSAKAPAIMVTGSHIPADRNGLKFYLPDGEVSKEDELAINEAYVAQIRYCGTASGTLHKIDAETPYIARYLEAFGASALKGLKIGVYRHSSVARDTMEAVIRGLGAEVVPLANSDTFIPVDTEAVDPETREKLRGWCQENGLDAIASTDGDADRPMLTDETGKVIPGDILGVLTARLLAAKSVVTPVSSNDMVRCLPDFEEVILTRIGSPFVIAGMGEAANPEVVGFEANGGFLLGFEAQVAGPLSPLPTRDCMLPIIAPLIAAQQAGKPLSEVMTSLPPCFTAADRVQEIDRAKAEVFLNGLIGDESKRSTFFAPFGTIAATDLTDGLRIDFESGDVLHLRPSGNAPEFRIYSQAKSEAKAVALVECISQRVVLEVL
ncbi:phosphomannomutase [Celeribacter litoreus]|uniref:phosphomannomutase n=1 Tax=Celeribacter litoreus TaxID=2876714 RepID=UPI001CCA04E8|nr:phosphomannomutase [Celeribacter litoreus]MCA0044105.1 phosphomannomutase [Celeribacter litoreus]